MTAVATRPPKRSPVSPASPPLVTMLNGSDRLEEGRVLEVGGVILAPALPILDPLARRDGRGGCIADCGGDLAGQLAAHVAGRKDAGNAGHHRHRVSEVIARGVMVDVHVDERRVRDESDEDEDAADGELALLTAVHVAQREPLHTVDSVDRIHHGVREELDLGVVARLIEQDGLGAEPVAAVDDRHRAGIAREEDGLLDGRVTAADHREVHVAEERAVTHGAVRDTAAGELLLSRNAQLAWVPAGGEDERGRAEQARRGADLLDAVGARTDREHLPHHHFGAEMHRLLGHALGEVDAEDRMDPGVVFDQLGVEKLASGRLRLQKHGVLHVPSGVHRGSQPRGAGAHDGDVEVASLHVHGVPRSRLRGLTTTIPKEATVYPLLAANWFSSAITRVMGMAKESLPLGLASVMIPTTMPARSSTGPPLFPW